MRDGFIFYASFYEAIEELDETDQLEVYKAICQYALTGELPQCKGAARAIMKLVQPQIDANNKRRENGKKGAEVSNASAPEQQEVGNDAATERQPVGNLSAPVRQEVSTSAAKEKEKDKGKMEKENGKEKEREERAARTPFRRPTIEEIQEYCTERGNRVDPQTFYDFYESKGWRVGSQPMKDWRAAVRTWEKREETAPPGRSAPAKKPNRFNDVMEKHSYSLDDIAALERFNADRNARIAEEYYKKQRGATA